RTVAAALLDNAPTPSVEGKAVRCPKALPFHRKRASIQFKFRQPGARKLLRLQVRMRWHALSIGSAQATALRVSTSWDAFHSSHVEISRSSRPIGLTISPKNTCRRINRLEQAWLVCIRCNRSFAEYP